MTQPRKILSLAVFAAALFLLSARAAAQNYVTPTVKPTAPGQLIVVNNGPGNHTEPHVDGDLVCYTDQQVVTQTTIRYFNLTSRIDAMVPIANDGSLGFLCDVRVTMIVFTRSGSNARILAFDTAASGQPIEVAPIAGAPGGSPMRFGGEIGDQTMAWQDFSTGTYTVMSGTQKEHFPCIDATRPS